MQVFKSNGKVLVKSWLKILLLVIICIISVGMSAGIGSISNKMYNSYNNAYHSQKIPDIIGKGAITQDDVTYNMSSIQFGDYYIEENPEVHWTMDEQMTTSSHTNEKVRFYFQDLSEDGFYNRNSDKLVLKEGSLPESSNEILVRYQPNNNFNYKVGDHIDFTDETINQDEDGFYKSNMCVFHSLPGNDARISGEYIVSGIVIDPLYLNMLEEPTYFPYGYVPTPNEKGEDITNMFYFPTLYSDPEFSNIKIDSQIGEYFMDVANEMGIWGNECFMKIIGFENIDVFSNKYINTINQLIALGHTWNFVTLNNGNSSYIAFKSLVKNLGIISAIFPILFTLITALILYIIIERFIIDQRQSIACLLSQGVSTSRIYARVLYIGIFAAIVGSIVGFIIGWKVILQLLFNSICAGWAISFFSVGGFSVWFGVTCGLITLITSILVSCLITRKMLQKQPSEIMLPPAPKPGKKILLEKMPGWKKLSFKYKSSFKNIFRNKTYLSLMVICSGFTTALIFLGLALLDIISTVDTGSNLIKSIQPLLIFVVIIAVVFAVLIIYSLTRLNIETRRREIATLMVLGYTNRETIGYILRELFIVCIISIIFGMCVGVLILWAVVHFLGFGSLSACHWYIYISSLAMSLLIIGICDTLLMKKIINTDMNSSLKARE